jgi:hypothetical protein
MRVESKLIAGVAVLLLSPGLVFAATTSRLRVTVEDQTAAPLPGVSVRIESPALIGGPQTGATDAAGEVTFHLLPLGEYTVVAGLTGFEPAEALVPVRLDRTASAMFRLVPIVFAGEIEVAAEVPVVDLARTDLGQVLDSEYLERAAVGMDGRFFTGLLAQAPATLQSSNPPTAGSLYSENAYLIDGINAVDPATGVHGLIGTQLVGFDAIEEASVLTANYDAEYSYATGGVVNLVIKSGSNTFSGSFDARYRDQRFNEAGDHYDPDDDVSSRLSLAATLGGPILRDRLWFFTAFDQFQEEDTPTGAFAAKETTGTSFMAKLTWAASDRHRISALYHASPLEVNNRYVSQVVLPEASVHLDVERPRFQLELNSVLGSSMLLTVAGGTDTTDANFTPQSGDLETASAFDLDTPVLFQNGPYVEFSERNRDHVRGVLTIFAGEAAGSHELKLGGDFQYLHTEGVSFTPGSTFLYYYNNDFWGDQPWPDSNGDGLVDLMLEQDYPLDTSRDPDHQEVRGWGVYAQDEWRPVPSLTISAGLRYDSMAHTNTVGETIADFHKWQPRLGLAWDVGGRGRHVLRASWGRYTHPGVTNLAGFVPGVERGYTQYYGLDFLCGAWDICDRETARMVFGDDGELVYVDPDGFEHPYYLFRIASEIPAETVDTLGVGRLRMPYKDQLLLAYEAQVYDQTSLELAYLDARYGDGIEDTCINNTWAWGDGDPPTLDDPSTWTDESGCTGSVRANLEGLERTYRALILKAETRARSWFHLIGSYTYSRSEGNSPQSDPYYGFGSGGGFPGREYDHYPTNFLNLDGSFPEDIRHQLKINGFLLLPYDFAVGVAAFYESAPPLLVLSDCASLLYPNQGGLNELERLGIDYDQTVAYCQSASSGTYYLEPPGERRGGDVWQLDLEFSKGFTVGRANLRALVTVINVTSEQAPTGWTDDPFDSRGWGAPTYYQQPRRYEVGFRIVF